MTIKVCDICGEHMVDCGTSYHVTVHKYADAGSMIMSKCTADVCPSCTNKLKEKLKEMGVANLRWDG